MPQLIHFLTRPPTIVVFLNHNILNNNQTRPQLLHFLAQIPHNYCVKGNTTTLLFRVTSNGPNRTMNRRTESKRSGIELLKNGTGRNRNETNHGKVLIQNAVA